jgi:hypothetical protein
MSIGNMKSQAKYLREATNDLAELIEFAERWVYLNKQVPGAVVHTTRGGAKKWKIRKDQLPKKEKAPAKATKAKAKAKPKEAAKKKDTGLTIEELRRRLGWDLPSHEPKSSGLTTVRSGEREPFKHPTSGKIGQLPGKPDENLSNLDKKLEEVKKRTLGDSFRNGTQKRCRRCYEDFGNLTSSKIKRASEWCQLINL